MSAAAAAGGAAGAASAARRDQENSCCVGSEQAIQAMRQASDILCYKVTYRLNEHGAVQVLQRKTETVTKKRVGLFSREVTEYEETRKVDYWESLPAVLNRGFPEDRTIVFNVVFDWYNALLRIYYCLKPGYYESKPEGRILQV